MDNILLDGHIGIVFGLGIAILGYQRDAILKERSEGLASLLKEVCASVPQVRRPTTRRPTTHPSQRRPTYTHVARRHTPPSPLLSSLAGPSDG